MVCLGLLTRASWDHRLRRNDLETASWSKRGSDGDNRETAALTERLRAVVLAAEQLSPTEQDALADQIAGLLPPVSSAAPTRGSGASGGPAIDLSVFADLPEDAVDVLDRLRHDAAPTPLYTEA